MDLAFYKQNGGFYNQTILPIKKKIHLDGSVFRFFLMTFFLFKFSEGKFVFLTFLRPRKVVKVPVLQTHTGLVTENVPTINSDIAHMWKQAWP